MEGKQHIEDKSIICVPATPGGELARMFREVEKEQRRDYQNKMNLEIIEQTGLSLEKLFQKSNPFKQKDCEKSDCVVCHGNGVKCRDE